MEITLRGQRVTGTWRGVRACVRLQRNNGANLTNPYSSPENKKDALQVVFVGGGRGVLLLVLLMLLLPGAHFVPCLCWWIMGVRRQTLSICQQIHLPWTDRTDVAPRIVWGHSISPQKTDRQFVSGEFWYQYWSVSQLVIHRIDVINLGISYSRKGAMIISVKGQKWSFSSEGLFLKAHYIVGGWSPSCSDVVLALCDWFHFSSAASWL